MIDCNIRKILVCDFDGCLTSIDTGTYFSPDKDKYGPVKAIVDKLLEFCQANDAKILISSNWRKFEPDGTWTNMIGTYANPLPKTIPMLGDSCIGMLPPIRHVKKPEALKKWLEDNHYSGRFAIFDDDLREGFSKESMYGISQNFIFVDCRHGITDENLKTAKEILDGQ